MRIKYVENIEDDYYTELIDENKPIELVDFINSSDKDYLKQYETIENLYNLFISDYKKFPPSRSIKSLDSKYDKDHGRFYRKYIEFVNKCKIILDDLHISGYGLYDLFLIKIRDMLKSIIYNFPYGWKNQ